MVACTIIARNYLPQARVLARSFEREHELSTLFVLVVDDADGVIDGAKEPFTLVRPAELDLPQFHQMATMYDVTELCTALKPAILMHVLARTDGAVTYLDPDIEIFDSLEEVDGLADVHGLVLIPHLTSPLPSDQRHPSDLDILLSGTYNLGFIAVAPREEIAVLLLWWQEHLLVDCVHDPAGGHFFDQRWMDLSPGFVSDACVLRDPGYNVAYWNLPSRHLERSGDRYTANGAPLRFMHFSGFDPRDPLRLSRHQDREERSAMPVATELLARYAERLAAEAEADADAAATDYGYARTADGMVLHQWVRRLYRDGVRDGEIAFSAFDDDGAARLRAWLSAPLAPDAPTGLNRATEWVWRSRSDLQGAYPDLRAPDDVRRYLGWLRLNGRHAFPGLQAFLLPPVEELAAAMRSNRGQS